MMKAKDLEVVSFSWQQMDLAAMAQQRIRVRGVVTARGDGYSGRYSNVWLHVRTGDVTVQVTATGASPLGNARVGAEVDLALSQSGLVDLSQGIYFGVRAQLLNLNAGATRGPAELT